ncbi:MAG: hypothetical protein Q4D11_05175 [Rhodospirillales bacterium]|nr:hypothetical protein [Rhodospirillales bacterium]
MALMRKNKKDDITHISGLPGLIHKIVMSLTYPFRRPLRFLLFVLALCVIAYVIPILYGVAPKDVRSWYADLFKDVREQVMTVHSDKGTDQLVDSDYQPTPREVRRKMFEAATGQDPQRVDVLRESASDVVDIKNVQREIIIEEVSEVVAEHKPELIEERENSNVQQSDEKPEKVEAFNFEKHYDEYSNLDYLAIPVEISGTATVYNVNDIAIDETYVFLYGIYSNPRTEKGVKGKVFLKNFVQDEKVSCKIVAYTKNDKTATAVCYVGEIEINSLLVERGFSDRVSAR